MDTTRLAELAVRTRLNRVIYFRGMDVSRLKKVVDLPEPVALVGFAAEGRSSLRWLRSRGVQDIVVLDKAPVRDADSLGVRVVSGPRYLDGLAQCRSAIRSAGVYPHLPELADFRASGGVVTSQVEIFLQQTQSTTLAVTGTLGKGSTVSMVAHILKSQGLPHILGGNFGVPALDLLEEDSAERISLLELSSFQLMTVLQPVDIAVVLRTTSEHLDWHPDVEQYRWAKSNLVSHQHHRGTMVWCDDAEGSRWIAAHGRAENRFCYGAGEHCDCRLEGDQLVLDGEKLAISQCQVPGRFQLENMAAALLASRALGVAVEQGAEALRSYPGLPYRMQFSGQRNGLRFFNDSYATRPEATIGAVRGFDEPVALILGGSEKNADFAELAETLASCTWLRTVALIGDTARRLRFDLMAAGVTIPLVECPGLAEAFQECVAAVRNGGVVLLSPACASFGLFANYKVRGERFDALVRMYCDAG